MSETLRVLHVEDAKEFRLIVAKHLQSIDSHQFEIESVDGEAEAVACCQRTPYDLAIVDYELNDGDGLSCVAQLRKLDAYMPIIAISGRASDEIACDLLRTGVDDYFDKTRLRRADFQKSVLAALERGKNWRDSRSHQMVGRKVLERRAKSLREAIERFAEQELARHLQAIVESARNAHYDLEGLGQILDDAAPSGADSQFLAAVWPRLRTEVEREFASPRSANPARLVS